MVPVLVPNINNTLTTNIYIAEKAGFEPTIPFWGIRTFQARSLNHSDISPKRRFPHPIPR